MERVLHTFAYCLDFLRDQVADLQPDDMVAQPAEIRNHPAWVIGHLAYSCQALGGEMGLEPWLPQPWSGQFSTGSVPLPDVQAYPDKDELVAILRDAESRITRAVRDMDATQLNQPLPDERFREILPTVGHAITQVLAAHTANHIGQMTIWRRAMGLPPVSRPFV